MNYKLSQTIPIVQPLSPSIEPFMELGGTVAASSTSNDYFQHLAILATDQTQNTVATGLVKLEAWNDSDRFILHASSSSSAPATAAAAIAAALPSFTTATNLSAVNELEKQLEYDKFMNEIWIGIVLLLIFISMIFCVCSCLLYHQFRTWKRNCKYIL